MLEGKKASGDKIRQARLKAGFSQADLARRVGVSERNIVRWENNRHQPRLEHLLAVAGACGVHILELVDGPTDKDEEDSSMGLTRATAEKLGYATAAALAEMNA